MAETLKAKERRIREGFFQTYCQGAGIDIGCGNDILEGPGCGIVTPWDKQDGDATLMEGVKDDSYSFVYSSHCLEHVDHPHIAVQHWLRICKPGGYLILFIPDRRTYEKRLTLPSRWNGDHRTFWLPDRHEPPCTIGLVPFLVQWLNGRYELEYVRTCSEGHTITDPAQHSDGEYSIECVIRKRSV